MTQLDDDTICAIATPPGRGGIGIVRISGSETESIVKKLTGSVPESRVAEFSRFLDDDGNVLDEGILLLFRAPNSFTGETVAELQGHGGPQVLNAVLRRVLALGARLARPGEFSERAFLNGKIDLLQAEAVADLIDASSEQAARSAMQTLQGVFSARIHELNKQLTEIRVNVEAAIDFSDEDIDILADQQVAEAMTSARSILQEIFVQARQGALLKEGLNIVIAGEPNAGKSSLLNSLAGTETAIVTDIPGTTRDLLREQLHIDGLPLHITDTAGLRMTDDPVEQEGVRRALGVIHDADKILLVVDSTLIDEESGGLTQHLDRILETLLESIQGHQQLVHLLRRLCVVMNKTDLLANAASGETSTSYQEIDLPVFNISAKLGSGLDALRQHLKASCGFQASGEAAFIARERHLIALKNAKKSLDSAGSGISKHSPLELVAEDLRIAQQHLGSITGEFSSDDLLGEIFSSFCIGK